MYLELIKDDKAKVFVKKLEEMFESEEVSKLTGEDADEYRKYVTVMKENAVNYAKMRASWEFFSREEKIKKDDMRTGLHNDFMTSLKLLIRLANLHSDNKWTDLLNEAESMQRKDLGDIACYITYLISVSNR